MHFAIFFDRNMDFPNTTKKRRIKQKDNPSSRSIRRYVLYDRFSIVADLHTVLKQRIVDHIDWFCHCACGI